MSRAAILSVLLLALPSGAEAADRPLREWINDLDNASVLVRLEAIEVLADAGADAADAVPRLEKLVRTEPLGVRLPAALAIYRVTGRTALAITALAESLRGDTDPQARVHALGVLQLMGADAATAAGEILDLADDTDAFVRSRAVAVLACLGRPVVPAVLERLADAQPHRRRQAVRALLHLHRLLTEDDTRRVERGLEDTDSVVHLGCARVLWGRAVSSVAVVRVLTEAVRSGGVAGRAVLDGIEESATPRRRAAARSVLDAALRGSDPELRLRAARELYRIDGEDEALLPVCIAALKSPNQTLYPPALAALRGLGRRGTPALPVLIERFRDGDLHELEPERSFGCMGAAVVPKLIDLLHETRDVDHLARDVEIALARIGEPAIPALLPLLTHDREEIREAACSVLAMTIPPGKKVAPQLVRLLEDSSDAVRYQAIHALRNLGPAAREAVPRIVEVARKADPDFQVLCLSALSAIGGDSQVLTKAALAAMDSTSEIVRLEAFQLLWSVDPRHPACVRHAPALLRTTLGCLQIRSIIEPDNPAAPRLALVLIDRLRSEKNWEFRRLIALSLADIGPAAKDAVPVLAEGLTQPGLEVRTWTVECLQRTGGGDPRRMVHALVEVLDEGGTPSLHRHAIDLLGAFGAEAREAVPALLAILRWGTEEEIEAAARALSRISPGRGRRQGVRLLEKRLLLDLNPHIAAKGLLRFDPGHPAALATLRRVLHEEVLPDKRVLKTTLEALWNAGPAAKDVLDDVRALMSDRRPLVRIHAAMVAWRIGNDRDAAVRVLVEALGAEHPNAIHRYALEALQKMGPAAKAALPALRECLQKALPGEGYSITDAIQAIDPKAAPAEKP
jgi:HEAT repeat protein